MNSENFTIEVSDSLVRIQTLASGLRAITMAVPDEDTKKMIAEISSDMRVNAGIVKNWALGAKPE